MSLPRLLVLSGTAPSQPGVGSVFLDDLLSSYEPDRVQWAVVGPCVSDGQRFAGCLYDCHAIRLSRPLRCEMRLGVAGRLQRAARWYRAQHVGLARALRAVRGITGYGAPDLILGVLDEPIIFRLIRRLASTYRVPLVTLVWDPVDYLVRNTGCNRLAALSLMRDARTAMCASQRIGVISEAMADEYGGQSGRSTVVIRHGVPRALWVQPPQSRNASGPVTIAMAGSLYATETWDALVAALNRSGWRVNGRPVTIRMLGRMTVTAPSQPCRIEVLGWNPEPTMIAHLSEADIGYVPYPFDDARRSAARLSFPTKLGSYLAAGLPVLYHGPMSTAVSDFVSKFGIGLCCPSLASDQIIARLDATAEARADQGTYDCLGRALDEELGAHVTVRRFAALLDVDEGALHSR